MILAISAIVEGFSFVRSVDLELPECNNRGEDWAGHAMRARHAEAPLKRSRGLGEIPDLEKLTTTWCVSSGLYEAPSSADPPLRLRGLPLSIAARGLVGAIECLEGPTEWNIRTRSTSSVLTSTRGPAVPALRTELRAPSASSLAGIVDP